jgi:hypothetical protein
MSTTQPDSIRPGEYDPPADALLARGEPEFSASGWPDYVAEHGLAAEHVPELIRMTTDDALLEEVADTAEVWAPIHAWRALGQLQAEAAVEPLLSLLEDADGDNDWMNNELPTVLGMIGGPALPVLRDRLAELAADGTARIDVAEALKHVAEFHPSLRDEVVATLSERLEAHPDNDPELNAFLVSFLVELKAVEAAPLIERAFEADDVDMTISGDWEDAQVDLGLLEERITPRPSYGPVSALPSPSASDRPKAKSTKQQKRKMQKQSRKQNRKRK